MLRTSARVRVGEERWNPETGDYDRLYEDDRWGTIVSRTTEFYCDGSEYVESVLVRWDDGEVQVIPRDADVDDGVIVEDLLDVTPLRYVNVYLHDRAYGGSEEGGWWYDVLDPAADCPYGGFCSSDDEVERVRSLCQQWCDEENACRRSDISSVISEGCYEVFVEGFPATPEPERKPHYC